MAAPPLYSFDETLTLIADGLTRADERGDARSAARFRHDLGTQLLLRGDVAAGRLHLETARTVFRTIEQATAAARVRVVVQQAMWMTVAPGVGGGRQAAA